MFDTFSSLAKTREGGTFVLTDVFRPRSSSGYDELPRSKELRGFYSLQRISRCGREDASSILARGNYFLFWSRVHHSFILLLRDP